MPRTAKLFGTLVVALLAVAVSLVTCAPAVPAQQLTFRIGFIPILDSLPYFVMLEQGFAEKNGLQFVETTYPGGAAIIEAMAAGLIDVGATIGTVPILSAAERGLIPSTIIPVAADDFADPEHPGIGIVAVKSVTSWRDLEGQQIAVNAKNSISAAALIGRLKLEGVHDYTIVEIAFSNMGLAVAGGNIAAAALTEPFLTQSLLRGDGKFLDWIIGAPPCERFEFAMVAVRTSIYRNQPKAIKAFLRSYVQALEWTNQNADESRLVLARSLNLSPDVTQEMKLLRFSSDGRNDPALLESMQPLLVDIGMLKAPIPASQLYDETLLNEVLSEKR